MNRDAEFEVWQRVAGLAQSPSHDFHHIRRVQAYAEGLGSALNVDTDLVRLAAILHDLGRADPSRRHGLASIEASKELALEILQHLDLSDESRGAVIEAIETHDQPDVSPASPAGRILKDADFLAGFGAWGVLRIAMWSGETGRRVDDVITALTDRMQRRLESLEYQESRDAALREILVAKQFRSELDRPAAVGPPRSKGFYCVVEGISGGGKNTLAKSMRDAVATEVVPCLLLEEPGDKFRILRNVVAEAIQAYVPLRKALLIADRAEQCELKLRPALEQGDIAISVRSYLSTAVYQASDRADAYRTLLEHDWMPTCDLLLLLDLDAEVATARIKSRQKPAGDFESPEQLAIHRAAYLDLASAFPARRRAVVDASQSAETVLDQALAILRQEIELRHRNEEH